MILPEYAKRRLKDGNELALILPYYETGEKVRAILSDSFADVS